ncbi:FHA domain-containing protein [Nocardia sp. NPDC005978]|uniref:FHA domain-containing protein n=1 Tax=Nocardia sp. NPDC005978 TaxID=3156725 RepID=UPI0033A6084C
MKGRVEVVPGGHLVACIDGVIIVVAHRADEPVTADSEAVTVLDTLAELVQEAASRETRRTGRTFARLVSKWLMGRADEDRVEFGVLTPGTRGLSVFLHGGVTAILEDADHFEVLHGRDAGFTIDRVVTPAPAHAAAVFVDGDSPRTELPEPGIWSLSSGLMPGDGAMLWLGARAEVAAQRGAGARELRPRTLPSAAAHRDSGDEAAPHIGDGTPLADHDSAESMRRGDRAQRGYDVEHGAGPADPGSGRGADGIDSGAEQGDAGSPPTGVVHGEKGAEPNRSSTLGPGAATGHTGDLPAEADAGHERRGPGRVNTPGHDGPPSAGSDRPVGSGHDGTRTPHSGDPYNSGGIPARGITPPRAQPIVRGYLCARRHLNDPRAHLCSQCGARLDQPTRVLGEGIRPPLGLLLLDNGTFYILDSDLVIGREPERSDQVRRGAQPVRIPDASAGMSRVHAEIRLVEWDVVVVDRGSANGTHIQQPGRQDWLRAMPGHPTPIQHGARVTLGGRVFTYDSQRRQR